MAQFLGVTSPSVTFDQWGLVGRQSEVRRFQFPDDSPVRVIVHEPPSGPANLCYQKYIEQDLANPAFVSAFLKGLQDSDFASKFVAPNANYRFGTGREVVRTLLADPALVSADFTGKVDGARFFECNTAEGRVETVKSLLCEASIRVTSTMIICTRTDLLPVAEDPVMCNLLTLRATDTHYVDTKPRVSGILGLAVAQAVLPDQILKDLTLEDVLNYRKEAASAYAGFTTEIDRLAAKLSTADPTNLENEINSLLSTDIRPRIQQYHRDMSHIRDKMFGELLKKVTTWEVPTLSLAQLMSVSWGQALAAFMGALIPAVPGVIDYVVTKREISRNNGLSYLIGVAPGNPSAGGA